MFKINAHWRRSVVATLLGAGVALPAAAQTLPASGATVGCGNVFSTSYGPYDYRIYKDRIEVKRVEEHHFTPLVEALIKPMFGKEFAPDFDYTLHTTPNHHRALAAMTRNSLRLRNPHPRGARWSVDCYFVRAMTFAPDDMVARMLYVDYLLKVGDREADGLKQLDFVAANAGENAFTIYNTGLLYFEAKQFDRARQQAVRAAALGLTWPDLRRKLEAAGQWQADAGSSAGPAPAPAASAAAATGG
jgi:hypothetical protein